MDILRTSLAVLYGAVNKRFLSTRETRELVLENVGFGLNPGVELAPRAVSFPTGETARRARTCRMWRIRAAVTASAAVKIMGVGIWYANSMAPRHGFEPRLTGFDAKGKDGCHVDNRPTHNRAGVYPSFRMRQNSISAKARRPDGRSRADQCRARAAFPYSTRVD